MGKRAASEDAPEASPSKRRLIEADDGYIIDDGGDDDEAYTPSSATRSATPSSSANGESPVTAATTPRAKFPSDYKTLACTWPGCSKLFNRPARLRDHMNSHTNSRPHKCPYDGCEKDYIEDKHLKQHIKAVHKKERRYVCGRDGCGKSFVTGTRLKRHQAVHDGADRFRCAACGQSFRKRETLGTHARREHLGERAYPCAEPGCARGFDTKPALQRHRQREHGEPRFWCAECAPAQRVGFTTDAGLQHHLKHEHQRCLFCDFRSASLWEFQTHVDIHHSGKSLDDRRTVACPHDGCRKKFTKRSNLNVHIRSAHQGVRFVCGADVPLAGPGLDRWDPQLLGCGAKFSTKVRLEDHVRFIHLGHERPRHSAPAPAPAADLSIIDELAGIAAAKRHAIPCPEPTCGEAFARYFDLNEHLELAHNAPDDAGAADFPPDNIFPEMHDVLAHNEEGLDPGNHEAWEQAALFQEEEELMAAAEMEFDLAPPQDWIADDASILMLAGDQAIIDYTVDPTSNGPF